MHKGVQSGVSHRVRPHRASHATNQRGGSLRGSVTSYYSISDPPRFLSARQLLIEGAWKSLSPLFRITRACRCMRRFRIARPFALTLASARVMDLQQGQRTF